LLDFLGSFEDEEDGWVDPFEFLVLDEEEEPVATEREAQNE
jgi:hypothetical protein